MGKPTICIGENKDADQLRGNRKAFVFATRIVQFLFYLNPNFQDSSSFLCLFRPVCVGPVRKPHCWFSHEAAHVFSDMSTQLQDFTLSYESEGSETQIYDNSGVEYGTGVFIIAINPPVSANAIVIRRIGTLTLCEVEIFGGNHIDQYYANRSMLFVSRMFSMTRPINHKSFF